MLATTIGQLLINDVLPEDLRDYTRVLDKKGTKALFQQIADKYPDRYREIAKQLSDIGYQSAYEGGGFSFSPEDLALPERARQIRAEMIKQTQAITRDKRLSDEEKDRRVVAIGQAKTKELEDVIYEEMVKVKNPLAMQVLSGARGSPSNLRSIVGSDLLYEDHNKKIVPILISRSYSEGLKPAEYFAASYGTRKGVADLKMATAKAGFYSKLMNQATHRLLITDRDAPDGSDYASRGVPMPIEDRDNEGALLARDTGGYKRNTVLTPKILAELKAKKFSRILVRSPITGGPPQGGLYAFDVGVRERGGISPIGDNVGIAAAAAVSEPLTQAQICLHEDTLVRMYDWSVMPIKDIAAGAYVLGCNNAGYAYPVRVYRNYNNGPKQCYRTTFRHPNVWDDELTPDLMLESTLDHKVLAIRDGEVDEEDPRPREETWIREQVPIGDPSISYVATATDRSLRLAKVNQEYMGSYNTRDLDVEGDDHLFVLANGLVVSNSSKHTGGVAGAGAAISGFQVINNLSAVPKTYPGGAAHAQTDGRVGAIYDAPAGGKYVMINGTRHYVHTGFQPTIKTGDTVEAGDVISDGLPNPSEIVRYKGIGEGRRYFVDLMRKVYRESNLSAHRRNIELLSRGLINHVRLTEEMGDYNPDDIVPYDILEHLYQPRPGHEVLQASKAVGKYLERPVLHYTIGTKVKPSMLNDFKEFGVDAVTTHAEPPPFQPEMIRAMENLSHDPDWMTRMLGSGLKKSLLTAAHRGAVSDETGTSFVAPMARAEEFGRTGLTKAWTPKDIIPVPKK